MTRTNMDFITENLLTILILLPVFGAFAVLGHAMFWKQEGSLKWITLGFTIVNFLISLFLLADKGAAIGERIFLREKHSVDQSDQHELSRRR